MCSIPLATVGEWIQILYGPRMQPRPATSCSNTFFCSGVCFSGGSSTRRFMAIFPLSEASRLAGMRGRGNYRAARSKSGRRQAMLPKLIELQVLRRPEPDHVVGVVLQRVAGLRVGE